MTIVFGVLFALAVVACIVLTVLLVRAHTAERVARDRNAQVAQQNSFLEQQLAVLRRYQAIVDAEAAARQVRDQANADAARVMQEAHHAAQTTVSGANAEASRILASAQAGLATATMNAQGITARATEEAHAILDAARQESERAHAAALEAAADAKALEKTAQAMRNVIDGYGDRYVVPTSGLLDELAEEFSFTDAGQKLKEARSNTRDMIRTGAAAECDYVEANRRATAIEFVLDAFNGKVDTILATVKEDNFGTLEQKIRDAFSLVNHNGAAFRSARITLDYLNARLAELRWAVVAQQLKLKDREEQRLIKERIREEERAQKEYERALKEAQRDEEALRKAMEKAQQQIDKASAEQKAKYEQQLRDLEQKLREAEEKGQRALSMAQQTRSGHVYIISNVGSFGDDVLKIGLTRRLEPLDRVRELGDASVPFEFDVHALIRSDDAPALEHALHKRFVRNQLNKVNPRKEFFRIKLHDIREEIEKLGIQVTWTMTAACKEYRESLAIERALADKTLDEAAWKEKQLAREAAAEREPIEATA